MLHTSRNKKTSKSGAVKGLPIEQLKKLKIPFPSLEIQEKISIFLDEFRLLKEQLKEDIYKEVKLNDKKYEYYRNLLLFFSK